MNKYSDLLEVPTKPDPDSMQSWLNSEQTQWFLKTLTIEYFELLESLPNIALGSAFEDLKQLHVSQGGLNSLEFAINIIEDCAIKEKDDKDE